MIHKEDKIPKWKQKRELREKQSFDDAFEALGAHTRFFNKKEIVNKLTSPLQENESIES